MILDKEEALEQLKDFVKKNKIHVQNPNFKEINFYSAQWKIAAGRYYYQLPNNGPVICTERPDGKFDFTPVKIKDKI